MQQTHIGRRIQYTDNSEKRDIAKVWASQMFSRNFIGAQSLDDALCYMRGKPDGHYVFLKHNKESCKFVLLFRHREVTKHYDISPDANYGAYIVSTTQGRQRCYSNVSDVIKHLRIEAGDSSDDEYNDYEMIRKVEMHDTSVSAQGRERLNVRSLLSCMKLDECAPCNAVRRTIRKMGLCYNAGADCRNPGADSKKEYDYKKMGCEHDSCHYHYYYERVKSGFEGLGLECEQREREYDKVRGEPVYVEMEMPGEPEYEEMRGEHEYEEVDDEPDYEEVDDEPDYEQVDHEPDYDQVDYERDYYYEGEDDDIVLHKRRE